MWPRGQSKRSFNQQKFCLALIYFKPEVITVIYPKKLNTNYFKKDRIVGVVFLKIFKNLDVNGSIPRIQYTFMHHLR